MACKYPITVYGEAVIHATGEVVYERQVPCGKCSDCLGRHAYGVYKRLEYEASLYDSLPLFVTLTYADEHLPLLPPYMPDIKPFDRRLASKVRVSKFAIDHLDELFPSVSKPDFQKFMKDLRYRLGKGLRFFCLAEYGGETARPHYHLLLFNHGLPASTRSMAYDLSPFFSYVWGKGHCLCELAPTSAMKYVAGYHAIRQSSPPGSYPSFTLSSRRPGIGHLSQKDSQWVKDHSATDRAGAYARLAPYQKLQVYPDGDFLVSSREAPPITLPDSEKVDDWFRRHKLRDHGKFTNNI